MKKSQSQQRRNLNLSIEKYDECCISYGFTYCGDESCPIPKCIVRKETLKSNSMVPSKLLQHLTTKHPTVS